MRALITNDDGIDSPGLWALAAAAREAGFDVTVAAPHTDASGTGSSVQAVRGGSDGRVRVHLRRLPGLSDVTAYAVEAHPAFIVHAASHGWLDPGPDVVLSGINVGSNVGRAVLHSGTVGAALAGSLQGARGLAVSLDTSWPPPRAPHWEAAVAQLPTTIEVLLAAPVGTVLNLNAPDRPAAELGALREARLAPGGAVQVRTNAFEADGVLSLHSTISAHDDPPAEDTDVALLAAGHPTLTRLVTVGELPGVLPAAGS